MITIIHGEDIVSSGKFHRELADTHKGKEIVSLENPKENELKQAIESKSLFGEEKVVLISKITKYDNLAKIINLTEIPVYIFSEKNLSKTVLAQFPKSQVLLFKPKAIIFDFLESIKLNNQKNTLRLCSELLKTEEPDLIFYMLIRQFRNLILVKDGSWVSEISPWQKSKLVGQAQYFSLQKLLEIYKTLEQMDFENKTGQSPLDLSKSLELFLLKI